MKDRPHIRVGAHVCVRDLSVIGHYRVPQYIRRQRGRVERYCGAFANPERLAYGENGLPKVPLYRVRFLQSDIWPDYAGNSKDTLDIEMYEHWLEECSSDSEPATAREDAP